MKLETANAIKNAAEVIGYDMEVRPDYSGWGMFGKTCAGIVFESDGELMQAVAYAYHELASGDDESLAEGMLEDIGRFRRDSMGRSHIVY